MTTGGETGRLAATRDNFLFCRQESGRLTACLNAMLPSPVRLTDLAGPVLFSPIFLFLRGATDIHISHIRMAQYRAARCVYDLRCPLRE